MRNRPTRAPTVLNTNRQYLTGKMRELLIVGIDPGTTAAYAVLDIKGNVLRTRSSKLLDLNSLVGEITGMGSVLAVGTDRAKCPALVERFAAKTGAKAIAPREDLLTSEKDEMTAGYETPNSHEKDALAAALYAYKELEPLLLRITNVLKEEGKQELFSEVTEVVVMAGRNIKDALQGVEENLVAAAQKEENAVAAAAAEVPEKTAKEAMQELQIKRLQRENGILREYNSKLLARMKEINRELRRVTKRGQKAAAGTASRTHRDDLAKKMQSIINGKERLIAKLKAEQARLGNILETEGVVVRKLKALGFDDIRQLKENSAVLVESISSFSEKALSCLQGRNITVITKEKGSGKLLQMFQERGIAVIPAEAVIAAEAEGFAAADSRKLEAAKKAAAGKNVLGMIESYKEERKSQLM